MSITFLDTYPDQPAPAHLQKLVSDYATYQALVPFQFSTVVDIAYLDRDAPPIPNWFPVLSLGASLQQQSFYFILTQNLKQSFRKKERN